MTIKELTELKELRNMLRTPLGNLDINVDDMDAKTLHNVEKVYNASAQIAKEREDTQALLERTVVNYSTVSDRSGLDRHTIADNATYRKIVDAYSISGTERKDNEALAAFNKQRKAMQEVIKEYERREKENISAEIRITELSLRVDNLTTDLDIAKTKNRELNAKNAELQAKFDAVLKTSVMHTMSA